eukprot:CAMPEP_0182600976 /NCGR_PEP_ID=MMETSP1324-20130603/91252_1 /TAXON_ID=236786 /ORGANISM="Florenciella sp., Strain RCC1587" /LENGTH=203 /DNA_ID=CAMNT_0024818885 /DNA_START=218 /DNA_END=829 /DNA_ORIENTATION=+
MANSTRTMATTPTSVFLDRMPRQGGGAGHPHGRPHGHPLAPPHGGRTPPSARLISIDLDQRQGLDPWVSRLPVRFISIDSIRSSIPPKRRANAPEGLSQGVGLNGLAIRVQTSVRETVAEMNREWLRFVRRMTANDDHDDDDDGRGGGGGGGGGSGGGGGRKGEVALEPLYLHNETDQARGRPRLSPTRGRGGLRGIRHPSGL